MFSSSHVPGQMLLEVLGWMCLLRQGGRGSVTRDSSSSWAALKSTGLQKRLLCCHCLGDVPSGADGTSLSSPFFRVSLKSGMNDSREFISSNTFSSTLTSLLQHFMPEQHKDPAEQRHSLCSQTGGDVLVV